MKKMKILGTAILTMLFMFSLTQLSVAQDSNDELEVVRIKAKVDCNGCKTKIEKNIAFEKGVKYVNADVSFQSSKSVVEEVLFLFGKIRP